MDTILQMSNASNDTESHSETVETTESHSEQAETDCHPLDSGRTIVACACPVTRKKCPNCDRIVPATLSKKNVKLHLCKCEPDEPYMANCHPPATFATLEKKDTESRYKPVQAEPQSRYQPVQRQETQPTPVEATRPEDTPTEQEEDPDACKCGMNVACPSCRVPLEVQIAKTGRRYHACDCKKPGKTFFKTCQVPGLHRGVDCPCRDPFKCPRRCPASRGRASFANVATKGENEGKPYHSCDWCGDCFTFCSRRPAKRPGMSVRSAVSSMPRDISSLPRLDSTVHAQAEPDYASRYVRPGMTKRVRASPPRTKPGDSPPRREGSSRSPPSTPVQSHVVKTPTAPRKFKVITTEEDLPVEVTDDDGQ